MQHSLFTSAQDDSKRHPLTNIVMEYVGDDVLGVLREFVGRHTDPDGRILIKGEDYNQLRKQLSPAVNGPGPGRS